MNVMFLADEWGSSKGGLSTIKREVAKTFSKCSSKVNTVYYLVPPGQAGKDIKEEAEKSGVQIVEAKKYTGMSASQLLCFPPDDLQIDVVVGHGRKLGPQAQIIKENKTGCKWVQFVHVSSEDIGMYKGSEVYEEKHKVEVELCEKADLVVAVGPKLAETYTADLRYCEKPVQDFTPGIFEEFAKLTPPETDTGVFHILLFGRGGEEDFKLKGYDIAAQAVDAMHQGNYELTFVGAPKGKVEEVKNNLLKQGIQNSKLKVRRFCEDRKELSKMFSKADLCLMPSRTEGFGLTALEALSAGVPVLVTNNSGLGKALEKVPYGNTCIVGSEEPDEWKKKIEDVLKKKRGLRLVEAAGIRDHYKEKYPWYEQCSELVECIYGLKVRPYV